MAKYMLEPLAGVQYLVFQSHIASPTLIQASRAEDQHSHPWRGHQVGLDVAHPCRSSQTVVTHKVQLQDIKFPPCYPAKVA
jgi:hypothetical protein